MVLAAGLGTRLRPLTDELPKPLCWLGNKPQIDHVLETLAHAGHREAVINTHHLAERFDAAWRARQPLAIQLSHEPEILGTGGGVAHAAALLGPGDVLVVNADIVALFDLEALYEAHARAGALATLVIAPRAGERGTVGLDAAGNVTRLRSLVRPGEVDSADYAGIALLSAALRARLSAPSCLVGDGFMPALERGERLATFRLEVPFTDIGSPAAALAANLDWLAARGLHSYVDPQAEVADEVRLVDSVVASGARVTGSGALERVLVWPHAVAVAPLQDAIVTPRGVLTLG